MFKKQFKISNSHSLANKDKKKLRESLVKQGFDGPNIEAFLDDKQFDSIELTVDKLAGSKVQLLTRSKTPLMFTVDSRAATAYYPTIYLLFRLEKLPPLRIYLKEGVEQYIFNGADLMWPGIKSFNTEDFKQFDMAVIYSQ
jgi:predicted ribosome-associated RNA-binding protein Tma20